MLDDIETLLEDASFTVEPGDVILLYTDGITEMKTDGGRLGIEALKRMFKEVGPANVSSRAVVDGLFARVGAASFQDDATIMAISRHKPAEQLLS